MDYDITYAHTVDEGAALAATLSELADRGTVRHVGFDTEFDSVRVGKESTVARAKVYFASLAWDPGGARLHPRGFPIPRAAVVSREVVTRCEPFRKFLERPDVAFLAHNAPVDVHSMKNEGVEIRNVINTLTLARWCWPGRARAQYGGGGFTLDALGKDVLGEGKTIDFTELFTTRREQWTIKSVTERWCMCGEPGCRKRSLPLHKKVQRTSEIREPSYVEELVPLSAVGPGHELFDATLKYSAQDAVLAFGLYHVIQRELNKQYREVPWLK